MKRILCLLVLCPVLAVSAADEYKISQLEQAVRTLQRQLQEQSRQLDELRSRLAQPGPAPAPAPPRTPATAEGARWLDADRWQQLRPGMTELQVIELLGVPTSMRTQDEQRVLFYAMEIGAAGFLGGSVTLRERRIVDIRQPSLR